MRSHANRLRASLLPGLLWASASAWAQAPASTVLVHADEMLPTRFILCQREINLQSAQGDRDRQMRTCLKRRLEGERAVDRDCRRQSNAVSGTAARAQAKRDCERQALAVVSTELPKAPPPPAPRPLVEVSGNVPVTGRPPAEPAAARMPSMPAAGQN